MFQIYLNQILSKEHFILLYKYNQFREFCFMILFRLGGSFSFSRMLHLVLCYFILLYNCLLKSFVIFCLSVVSVVLFSFAVIILWNFSPALSPYFLPSLPPLLPAPFLSPSFSSLFLHSIPLPVECWMLVPLISLILVNGLQIYWPLLKKTFIWFTLIVFYHLPCLLCINLY